MTSITATSMSSTGAPFSQYKPSVHAYQDVITPSRGKARQLGIDREHVKVVTLILPNSQAKEAPVSDQLADLFNAIPAILSGLSTPQSFHYLCSTCHRLVLPPHMLGPTIYAKIEDELKRNIMGLARSWHRSIMSKEPGWLDRMISGWKTWDSRVGLLSAIFVYLDRVYAIESNAVQSIRNIALQVFREIVWDDELLHRKTRDDMLTWAAEERETGGPNEALRSSVIALTGLTNLLSVFSTLSDPYQDATKQYYVDKAADQLSKVADGVVSATDYVAWVLERVEEERERATTCFNADVASLIVAVVRDEAGAKSSDRIVRPALDEAMNQSDSKALAKLFQFSNDIAVFSDFVQALRQHISIRLKTLISDPANDSHMIESTLVLKRFADKAVTSLFPASTGSQLSSPDERDAFLVQHRQRIELEDAVLQGLKTGISSRQNAPAEWIAKHLDAVMRRGQGSSTEAEFSALLDEIIALVSYTPDKDVFKAFYSTQLAKRLLLNKSASDDMERDMILRLQKEMGEEFTSGDVMMKDLQLSESLVKSYQSAQAKNPEHFQGSGDFTANVLTESAWPAYPLLKDGWSFQLTPGLQRSIDAFTQWYSTQHQNRQLSWRYQLATVTMTARFDSGRYEITLSLFQAVVLLQFNEDDSLSFKELHERTGIETKELARTLQSLSLGRKGTRVLLKKPTGKDVNPQDAFVWNKSFTNDRIKFKINQIQQDMSAEETKKTNEQVIVDRVSVLEATIVRIMKARKKMTLQLLIDAVVTDVNKRFPPDIKELKKRVESLIEREFLKRDDDDRNVLHYLA